MTRPAATDVSCLRLDATARRDLARALPEESPVAVVCNGTTQAVMMASPEDIADFAHGFAWTEGFIGALSDIEEFEIVHHELGIEARFWLIPDRAEALAARRRSMAGPVGCGLCGIDSLAQAARHVPRVGGDLSLSPAEIAGAPEALRAHQTLHALTRGVHAAGFVRPGAGIALAREDVGRHNALDKLCGALLQDGHDPASGAVVMTSRLSLELVQKCAVAGVPLLIAVSAPTGAALRLAEEAGMTLVAFARGGGFEVYTHPDRIPGAAPDLAPPTGA